MQLILIVNNYVMFVMKRMISDHRGMPDVIYIDFYNLVMTR